MGRTDSPGPRLILTNPYGFLTVWDFSSPEKVAALADALRRMT